MTRREPVVVVGSGLTGALAAFTLAQRGFEVTVLEKGPATPHPRAGTFADALAHGWSDPATTAPADLAGGEQLGPYLPDLALERPIRMGGAASTWEAIVPRMRPSDFLTRSRFGFGRDWPIGYADLSRWYDDAEVMLGVSGAADDPAAPARVRPYPLPALPFTSDDLWLAERLSRDGIRVHATPQARLSRAYEGRSPCQNFGYCFACPTGARYAPRIHLDLAVATGHCRVMADVGVRRVVLDEAGRVRAVVVRGVRAESEVPRDRDTELPARILVLASGALETARLLLLSRDERRPDGIGNAGGRVGAGMVLHRVWDAEMNFSERLYPSRTGVWTGSIHQFLDPVSRGRHGGLRIECASRESWRLSEPVQAIDGKGVRAILEKQVRRRRLGFHAESEPAEGAGVTLGSGVDRWGDPVARVTTANTAFDEATYAYARSVFDRIVGAAGPESATLDAYGNWGSGCHHMGTTAMSAGPEDGVVDAWGRVHGTPNLYVTGPGIFAGGSGALNPGLTAAALALRTAAFIASRE